MGDRTEKRPYVKAQLHRYGSFTELTAGAAGSGNDAQSKQAKGGG
jgi:hypothetical protein